MNNFGVQLLLDSFLARSAPPAASSRRRPHDSAGRPALLRIRLQDPGEHGPAPPRPHRLRPRLLGKIRARHDRHPRPDRRKSAAFEFPQAFRPGARDHRRSLCRRHRRPCRPLRASASAIPSPRTPPSSYHEIPRFPPECFAYLHNPNPGKFKQFRKGMDQLLQEGVMQVFHLRHAGQRVPLLAAVGPLQFEVVQYRLESEYGAPSRLEAAPWEMLEVGSPRNDPRRTRCPQAPHRLPCRARRRAPTRHSFPQLLDARLFPQTESRGRSLRSLRRFPWLRPPRIEKPLRWNIHRPKAASIFRIDPARNPRVSPRPWTKQASQESASP